VLIIDNFKLLTGSDSQVIALMPLVLVAAAALGIWVGGRRKGELPTSLDEIEEPALTVV